LAAIPASIAAAIVAFLLNKYTVRAVGRSAVVTASPVIEEASKTILAVALGAPVVAAHLGFGMIEGLYDLSKGRPVSGLALGLSVLSHLVFGLVTYAAGGLAASWLVGFAVAALIHTVWNKALLDVG
jgi:hypothetical protein